MKTIFVLTLKAALRDPFLLFWSILLPAGAIVGLGLLAGQPEYAARLLAGMTAMSVFFYAFTTTAFAIMGQRRRGVYSLLGVTPMPLWQYVFAVASAWTVISLACALIVLSVGATALRQPLSVSALLLVVPVVFAAALGYVLLSFWFSRFCRNEAQVSMMTNLVALPLLLCSDAFYALESAPSWLQAAARLNPFQALLNGLRQAVTLQTGGSLLSAGLLLTVCAAALPLAAWSLRYADSRSR